MKRAVKLRFSAKLADKSSKGGILIIRSKIVSRAFVASCLLLVFISWGCSGDSQFGSDFGLNKKKSDDSGSVTKGTDENGNDDENTPVDEPVMIAGSFLTCAITDEAGAAEGEVGIGCRVAIEDEKVDTKDESISYRVMNDSSVVVPDVVFNNEVDPASHWSVLIVLGQESFDKGIWITVNITPNGVDVLNTYLYGITGPFHVGDSKVEKGFTELSGMSPFFIPVVSAAEVVAKLTVVNVDGVQCTASKISKGKCLGQFGINLYLMGANEAVSETAFSTEFINGDNEIKITIPAGNAFMELELMTVGSSDEDNIIFDKILIESSGKLELSPPQAVKN